MLPLHNVLPSRNITMGCLTRRNLISSTRLPETMGRGKESRCNKPLVTTSNGGQYLRHSFLFVAVVKTVGKLSLLLI